MLTQIRRRCNISGIMKYNPSRKKRFHVQMSCFLSQPNQVYLEYKYYLVLIWYYFKCVQILNHVKYLLVVA